jgi:DNA-binding FrmR family transcriptional regulator
MTGPASGDRAAAIRHAQRASGQVAALASMIAGDQPFPRIAQQLLAARGSLDSLLVRLVELEVRDCVTSREARMDVDRLLRTALGRGGPGRSRLRIRHPSAAVRSRLQLEETTP